MSSYVTRKTPGDTAWFRHDRFGMFIHWGLYAAAGPPRMGENPRAHPGGEVSDKYFDHFDPDLFDPREWARQAKAAGMKYAVLYHQASRGLLHVRQPVHRLQVHQHPGRARS